MSSSSSQRFVAACIALVIGTAPCPVHAQTDEQKAHAKDLFADGLDLREKGDERAALAKFKAAYELVKSPITTLEYGRSLVRLKLYVAADAKFIEASKLPEKTTESQQAKEARKEAATLGEEAARHIATLTFTFEGVSGGEKPEVTIDSVPLESPDEAKVDPGRHEIVARVKSGNEQRTEVELGDGESRAVVLTFDGGGDTSSANGAGAGPSTLTYVAFGIAGAGLLVGTIEGLTAISRKSDLDNTAGCPSACPADKVDDYHHAATISTISFVIAGAAIGVGVYSLLSTSTSDNAHASARVQPWIGIGAAGIAGAF